MVSGSSTSSSSTGADSPAKSANAECAQQWPRPDSNSRKIESTAPPTGEPTLRKSLRNCSTPANCDPVPHWSVSATIWRSVHRKCCCETDSAYRMILRLQASTALPRAADFTPPITSFEYLPADQGRTSVRLLLEWLKKKQPPASLELQGKTVPAQSTPA